MKMFVFCLKKHVFLYKQDIETTVNLRYVTSGSLKTSRRDFDPESGLIKLSLRIADERWQPRMGLDKWNASSKTFVEVSKPNTCTLWTFKQNYIGFCTNMPRQSVLR